jgi:hypothetical protein
LQFLTKDKIPFVDKEEMPLPAKDVADPLVLANQPQGTG